MNSISLKEGFRWAQTLWPQLKEIEKQYENDGMMFYEVRALHADIKNRNARIYTAKQAEEAASSLSRRPLNINHDPSRVLPYPENQVVIARYEDAMVECIIQVGDKWTNAQIANGNIQHVSVEGFYLDETNNTSSTEYPTSLHFEALALLTNDDHPGDPLAVIVRESLDGKRRVLLPYGEILSKLITESANSKFALSNGAKSKLQNWAKQNPSMAQSETKKSGMDPSKDPEGYFQTELAEPEHKSVARAAIDNEDEVSPSMIGDWADQEADEYGKNVSEAEWSSSYVNDLPDSSFAAIEPGGRKDQEGKTVPRSLRHLPYKDGNGKVDPAHVRNALARLSQTQMPAQLKGAARQKLVAAAKQVGIDTSMDVALANLRISKEILRAHLRDDFDGDAEDDPLLDVGMTVSLRTPQLTYSTGGAMTSLSAPPVPYNNTPDDPRMPPMAGSPIAPSGADIPGEPPGKGVSPQQVASGMIPAANVPNGNAPKGNDATGPDNASGNGGLQTNYSSAQAVKLKPQEIAGATTSKRDAENVGPVRHSPEMDPNVINPGLGNSPTTFTNQPVARPAASPVSAMESVGKSTRKKPKYHAVLA